MLSTLGSSKLYRKTLTPPPKLKPHLKTMPKLFSLEKKERMSQMAMEVNSKTDAFKNFFLIKYLTLCKKVQSKSEAYTYPCFKTG